MVSIFYHEESMLQVDAEGKTDKSWAGTRRVGPDWWCVHDPFGMWNEIYKINCSHIIMLLLRHLKCLVYIFVDEIFVCHASSGSIDKIKARFEQKLLEWHAMARRITYIECIMYTYFFKQRPKRQPYIIIHITSKSIYGGNRKTNNRRISRSDCVCMYASLRHYFILCIFIICIYSVYIFVSLPSFILYICDQW